MLLGLGHSLTTIITHRDGKFVAGYVGSVGVV